MATAVMIDTRRKAGGISMKTILSLLSMLSLILIACSSPQKSLIEDLNKGIAAANSHDYAEFKKYIDVEGIIDSYILSVDENSSGLSLLVSSAISPKLQKTVQTFIETNGSLDARKIKPGTSTIEGKKALLPLKIYCEKYSDSLEIILRFRQTPECWQVAGIDLSPAILAVQRDLDSTAEAYNRSMAVKYADISISSDIKDCLNNINRHPNSNDLEISMLNRAAREYNQSKIKELKSDEYKRACVEKYSIHPKIESYELVSQILASILTAQQ
jgi:hypothetical protein